MTLREQLRLAGVGWLAGTGSVLVIGFIVFPAVSRASRFGGTLPELLILGVVLLISSVASLFGGLLGGRLENEGGERSQLLFAALLGVIFASPVSCLGFWYGGW